MTQSRELSPLQSLSQNLGNMQQSFEDRLPKHIDAKRFIKVIASAASSNPDLLQADRASFFQACLSAAEDGLMVDGKEAAIVVYNTNKGTREQPRWVKTAKLMPMVGGMLKKARNSGEIKTIDAQVVYENDSYEAWTDENGPHFKHVKARKDRGGVLLTYAYAQTKDGGLFFEELDEEQMGAIKNTSKAKSTIWEGPFADEMRRKSALRRLAKYRLPSSSDINMMLHNDEDLFDPEEPELTPPVDSPTNLKTVLEAEESQEAPEDEPIDVEEKLNDMPI